MDIKEYLRILFSHRKLIISLTIITTIFATIGGFIISPKYEAKTTILIKSAITQTQNVSAGFSLDPTTYIKEKGETFGNILKSRAVAEKIVQILNLDQRITKKYKQKNSGEDSKQNLIKDIQKSITSKLISSTSLIELKVIFPDKKIAADIANTAAKVFVEQMRAMNAMEATIVKEFTMDRVKVAEGDLAKTQEDFRKFIIQEGFVYPEKKTEMSLREMVSFESSLKNSDSEIEQLKTKLNDINKKLGKHDKTLVSSTTLAMNPVIQDLKLKLTTNEIQQASLSVDYGPLHPKMITFEEEKKKIAVQLESEVKKIIQSEIITVNPIYQQLLSDKVTKETELYVQIEKKKELEKIIKNFPKDLTFTAQKQIQWEMLDNAVKFGQKNLDSLKSQLELARISEAQKTSEINVIDVAIPPFKPKFPQFGFPFVGFFVGLIGGIGLAFILEYVDDSINQVETIEEELNLPVYGVIPEIKSPVRKETRKKEKDEGKEEMERMFRRLITHFEPKSPIAEAYRSLRTNIQFADLKEKNKILAFTSSLKGEGKTTTAANLGITLAQLGNKTLLVDADMRSPRIHNLFQVEKDPGLSNYIGCEISYENVIQPSGINNLYIVSSGPIPPNPSELLNSIKLDAFIEEVKNHYDFVLFDTPPIIAVTDAAVLSSKVHGIFMIIQGGKTSKRTFIRAKMLLEKVNAHIFGAIMNNLKMESRYGYEYYYEYGYGEKRKKKSKKSSS